MVLTGSETARAFQPRTLMIPGTIWVVDRGFSLGHSVSRGATSCINQRIFLVVIGGMMFATTKTAPRFRRFAIPHLIATRTEALAK